MKLTALHSARFRSIIRKVVARHSREVFIDDDDEDDGKMRLVEVDTWELTKEIIVELGKLEDEVDGQFRDAKVSLETANRDTGHQDTGGGP